MFFLQVPCQCWDIWALPNVSKLFFFFFLICRYEAELNPVDHQKANVLKYQMEKRPFFEMPSHLADVDLDEYDYEEDFEQLLRSTLAEEKGQSAAGLLHTTHFSGVCFQEVSLVLCLKKYLITRLPFKRNAFVWDDETFVFIQQSIVFKID